MTGLQKQSHEMLDKNLMTGGKLFQFILVLFSQLW